MKLLFTAATLVLMMLAGRRYYPVDVHVPVASFAAALLLSTWSILSIGFLIASIVPTARFAQPIGAVLTVSDGWTVGPVRAPVEAMPPAMRTVSRLMPLTYSVSLLRGIWNGDPWSAHLTDVAALIVIFVVCVALSSKVFRWE